MIAPLLPAFKRMVIETITTRTSQIAYIGNVEFYFWDFYFFIWIHKGYLPGFEYDQILVATPVVFGFRGLDVLEHFTSRGFATCQ